MAPFDRFPGLNGPSKTRRPQTMAEWKTFVDGLSRIERDRLYPGMHIDLIPAFEMIEAKGLGGLPGLMPSANEMPTSTFIDTMKNPLQSLDDKWMAQGVTGLASNEPMIGSTDWRRAPPEPEAPREISGDERNVTITRPTARKGITVRASKTRAWKKRIMMRGAYGMALNFHPTRQNQTYTLKFDYPWLGADGVIEEPEFPTLSPPAQFEYSGSQGSGRKSVRMQESVTRKGDFWNQVSVASSSPKVLEPVNIEISVDRGILHGSFDFSFKEVDLIFSPY